MYKVKTNLNTTIDLDIVENQYVVDQSPVDFSFVKTGDNTFHLLVNNRSFHAELHEIDYRQKKVFLKVDGKEFHIEVADDFDLLLKKMGIDVGSDQKITELKAPMSGLVLSIKAKPGETLEAGKPLLVLEAMKMENVLTAPTDVVISKVYVSAGDKVEKNQSLISFE